MRMKATKLPRLTSDTRRLLGHQEGRDVDFKEKPSGVKADDFVAFANGRGGTILVGVREGVAPTLVGCSVGDVERQALVSIAASCRPSIDIHIVAENCETPTPIFRIDVSEGPSKPYCTASGTYKIRSDGQNVAIDPPMMRAIILEAEADEFVNRFRAAADDVVLHLQRIHGDLARRIRRAEVAAQNAEDAAMDAEDAIDGL